MIYVLLGVLVLVVLVVLVKSSGSRRAPRHEEEELGDTPQPRAAPRRPTSTQVLPPGRRLDVVGESHYQGNLEHLVGGRSAGGTKAACTATLERDPSSRFDPNAVRVLVQGFQVGHLSREDAAAARPFLDELLGRGLVAECAATIVGGWDRGGGDRGSFGVRLNCILPGVTENAPEAGDVELVPKTIDRLQRAAGPAARRKVLANALPLLAQEAARNELLLVASKIEVAAVLEKVDGLKTPAAKRRHLVAALEGIRNDPVPDELQAQQIAWLEEALAAAGDG